MMQVKTISLDPLPKLLRSDTAVTDNEWSCRIELLSEFIQSFRPLLGIAFDFDGNNRTFFTKYEIHLVITFTPVEYL